MSIELDADICSAINLVPCVLTGQYWTAERSQVKQMTRQYNQLVSLLHEVFDCFIQRQRRSPGSCMVILEFGRF